MVSYQKHGLSGRHQGESEQRISPPQHSESDSLWKRFDKTHLLSKLKIYFSYGTLLSEIAGPRSSCWNSHIKKKCPPKRNLSSSKTINTKSGWKESICGFTSNLSSSFTPFRERFDGPTFRGPDQPRLMGVVLRRRSFPGSIYIHIWRFNPGNLKTWWVLEAEHFLISRGEKFNSQDSSRSSPWEDSISSKRGQVYQSSPGRRLHRMVPHPSRAIAYNAGRLGGNPKDSGREDWGTLGKIQGITTPLKIRP